MGYNITTVKVKECSLKIYKKQLEGIEDINYHENISGEWYIDLCERSMEGKVVGKILEVTTFDHSGEGSGSSYETLLKILENSGGMLHAVLIWEGGDSIQRLEVNAGEITKTDVDL